MRGTAGMLAVAIATLLVCCSADPHQDQDVSGTDHGSGEHYDTAEYKQKEDIADILRFLVRYENRNLNGIGGSTLIGRNLNGNTDRNLGGLGGSSLIGRNLKALRGSSMLQGGSMHGLGSSFMGKNLNGIGGSTMLGRDTESHGNFARNLDPLGGANLVRNLDSLGGANFVRNLDSLGGANFVRNLDSLGGANFVRNLDSLGGANFVRNLDSLGGANFVKRNLDQLGGPNFVKRNLDSLGGANFLFNGHKTSNLDTLGGGNLVRDVREARHSGYLPYQTFRRYDYISPYGKREPWPLVPAQYGEYYGDGFPKRNFDEIDRSSLNTFVKKRNFDEIDRSSMPFPYAVKRFYHLYGQNFLDIDSPASSLDNKKRYRPDYPMDEIDLSHFPIGSKRSQDSYPLSSNA